MDKLKALKPYFHDFYAGRDFLDTKADKSLWIILKLLDAVFRGIAQVSKAQNVDYTFLARISAYVF